MTLGYIGKWGEIKACKFLQKNKLFIEQKNVKSKHSELDIICFSKRQLIFVEVKTRSMAHAMNFPIFESISDKKIQHIQRGIKNYINNNFAIIKRRRIQEIRIDFIFIHYKKGLWGNLKISEIIWKKTKL